MTNEQDLISIIMPAYNASAFIRESIESVLQQTYPNWELIIIDDGSTDDTPLIIKELQAQDARIIYHRQQNQRLGAARNTGISLANGVWIAFLDADDLWLNNKLQVQMDSINNQEISPDVVFTAGYYLNQNNPGLKPYDSLSGFYTGENLYPLLLKHNYIPVLSVLIRRAFSTRIGWQDTQPIVYGNEDWDYWLRACRAKGIFLGLEQRLFKYRVHDGGMSTKRAAMIAASCHVVCKNYDNALLNPADQQYHKNMLRGKISFISKRILKTGLNRQVIKLLFKMVSIIFSPVSALPKKQELK